MSGPATEYGRRALELHNSYRESHDASPLEWSHLLSMEARKHAIALAQRGSNSALESSTTNPGLKWGENVFEIRRRLADNFGFVNGENEENTGAREEVSDLEGVNRAIESWYEDRIDYDWGHDPASPTNSGMNFSQLVWKSTEKMGLGIGRSKVKDEDGKTISILIVVALYDPAGNIRGKFRDNVGVKKYEISKSGVSPKVATRSPSPPSAPPTTRRMSLPKPTPSQAPAPVSISISFSKPSQTSRKSPERLAEKKENAYITRPTTNFNSIETKPVERPDQTPNQNRGRSQSVPFMTPQMAVKSTTSTTLTKAVDLHNQYRRKHRAPPLKLSTKLTAEAQAYAETLASDPESKLEPSTNELARNVYRVAGGPVDENVAIKAAVSRWYGSSKTYNWSSPKASDHSANLFSQLIWRASKSIGVGVVSNNDVTVVVAFYTPAPGPTPTDASYRENVRPSIF